MKYVAMLLLCWMAAGCGRKPGITVELQKHEGHVISATATDKDRNYVSGWNCTRGWDRTTPAVVRRAILTKRGYHWEVDYDPKTGRQMLLCVWHGKVLVAWWDAGHGWWKLPKDPDTQTVVWELGGSWQQNLNDPAPLGIKGTEPPAQ